MNFSTSNFGTGKYKENPQPAAQLFPHHLPGMTPQIYQGRANVQFPPQAQWNQPWGQQPQHYQPMPQVNLNQIPARQNVPAPTYEKMSLGLETMDNFNEPGSQFFQIDKQFIQLEEMCNFLENAPMPGQKETLKLEINQTLSWLKQALEITPDIQRKALVSIVESLVKTL